MTYLKSGKLNLLLDGQFGSTGKGLISSYLGFYNHVDLAITNASPNAGHTFYLDDEKFVTHHLPISGLLNKRSTIYLCPGAIIDPGVLLDEINRFDVSPDRICIHPRCAVIEQQDIDVEFNGSVKQIASTRKGVGAALVRKINRDASLAADNELLSPFVHELDVQFYLDQGVVALMEVPQGFDLSLNSGLSYPHCTSREITVSSSLSDAQVHPTYLGNVFVCLRTFPIRVGHIIEDGVIVGNSGPFYADSTELSWDDVGVPTEFTTNTNRVRRVATFSKLQYDRMIAHLKPNFVFLNFANYLDESDLDSLVSKLPELTHICFGPKIDDVFKLI